MTEKVETKVEETFVEGPVSPESQEAPKEVEITLAKANKLRGALDKLINKTGDRISEMALEQVKIYPGDSLEVIQERIDSKKKEVNALSLEYGTLTNIRAKLKAGIANSNCTSGISGIMAEIDRVNTVVRLFSEIYGQKIYGGPKVRTQEEVDWILRSNDKAEEPRVHTVGLITQEDLDLELQGIASLEKTRSDLEEQRNVANYNNTLTISEDLAHFLRDRGVL